MNVFKPSNDVIGFLSEAVESKMLKKTNAVLHINSETSYLIFVLKVFFCELMLHRTVAMTLLDKDECAGSSICGSFGCTNTYGSYKCNCPAGYTSLAAGTSCQGSILFLCISILHCQVGWMFIYVSVHFMRSDTYLKVRSSVKCLKCAILSVLIIIYMHLWIVYRQLV